MQGRRARLRVAARNPGRTFNKPMLSDSGQTSRPGLRFAPPGLRRI